MQFTMREVKEIALTSFGGFVIAGIFGVVNQIAENKFACELKIPTPSLKEDQIMFRCFYRLERMDWDDINVFNRLVHTCDCFMKCRKIIFENTENPARLLVRVKENAFLFMKHAKQQMKLILKQETDKKQFQKLVNLEEFFQTISLQLERHFDGMNTLVTEGA